MEIEHIKIGDLHQDPANARQHPSKNLDAIKASLTKFGQQKPIVINSQNVVIAGNGTLIAAKEMEWDGLNCVRSELGNVEQVGFAVADNRTTDLSSWDMDILGDTLQSLQEDDWDLSELGFDTDDMGEMDFGDEKTGGNPGLTDEDEIPEVTEPTAKRGQIWKLGEHRVMCGDSTSKDDVDKLMDGEKADLLHTDPPYNVNYSNQDRPKPGKQDLGRIENDVMSDEDFLKFLTDSLTASFDYCDENSSVYIWYASKETLNFHTAAAAAGWNINQQIIWKKPMLLGRGKYQWAHEPCVFGVKGKPWFTDDRTKTTVWDFGGYDKSKNVHPTQKPVFIPEEAINNSSISGNTVLDLFLGSGSTLIACEKTGRKCYGMEIDPHYCDVIIKRWSDFTGNKAELIG